jgi:hypothetical protein
VTDAGRDGGALQGSWVGMTLALELEDSLGMEQPKVQLADMPKTPGSRASVGTSDKCQGQEAPVVIYSMATSRARCVCVMVAKPALSEQGCRSVRQMRFANGFCEIDGLCELSN